MTVGDDSDSLTMGSVYVIAVCFGLADAFFNPAFEAFYQEALEPEDLPSANAISHASATAVAID